jgi:protein-tyrosine-phosphatase
MDQVKHILFVCVGNSARSQMADGFFNAMAPQGWRSSSAGTSPAVEISSKTIRVLKEVGIDIGQKRPIPLTGKMLEEASKVITMGCLDSDSCPVFLVGDEPKWVDWKIPDPRGMSLEKYREVRDLIKVKVEELVAGLSQ